MENPDAHHQARDGQEWLVDAGGSAVGDFEGGRDARAASEGTGDADRGYGVETGLTEFSIDVDPW